ncbi:MAG: isopentenyl phosphate kinase [Candidatus Heimdallarchaeota archaeon]|nr:isopentenyl phosphate kinase [Candidatus Heimdallarchaeota archaeon]MDH5644654.1 isopentenyl phosphate kinase [Candidatus Heimdallarchaeota archaeon]
MNNKWIIVKLGGAAITNKNKDFSFNGIVVDRVMEEIKNSNSKVILVHGAGSYAHNIAKHYRLTDKTVTPNALSISLIRTSLETLHKQILDSANDFELPVFSLPISSILSYHQNDYSFYINSLKAVMNKNMIPVLYGDVITHDKIDFQVISGDFIIQLLCDVLGPSSISNIIFGTNVDGVFNKDPIHLDAKLIDTININEFDTILDQVGGSTSTDVTGGMRGKLTEINKIVKKGISVSIVNILKPNRLYRYLIGDDVIQTLIYSS